MSRRAKIVATLGPASSSPERLAELVAAGIDVARLNMSHGTQAGHLAAYQCVRAASDAAGHSVGVLIDLQGPKIRLGTFAAGPVRLLAGQEFTITTREVPGDQHEAGTTYAGPRRRRAAWRPGPGGRRPGRPRGARRGGRPGPHPGHRGRRRLRPQGPQPARRQGQRARPDRQGPGGPALGAQAAGGHDRAVFRPGSRGCRPGPADHGRGRGPAPADRENRETPGHRGAAGGHRGLRRDHGRPRGSRRGTSAGAGADGPEADRRADQGPGQAGHRGDPDAGVDDLRAPADPGGGIRRGQRRAGRRGRADAVRGDQRRRVPGPGRRDDEPHHQRGGTGIRACRRPRWPGSRPAPAAPLPAPPPRSARRSGPRPWSPSR